MVSGTRWIWLPETTCSQSPLMRTRALHWRSPTRSWSALETPTFLEVSDIAWLFGLGLAEHGCDSFCFWLRLSQDQQYGALRDQAGTLPWLHAADLCWWWACGHRRDAAEKMGPVHGTTAGDVRYHWQVWECAIQPRERFGYALPRFSEFLSFDSAHQ